MPKYPNIKIKLVGCDGNAFAILGRCFAAMRNNNMPESELDKFKKQATSGDYANLLSTCLEWFDVE